MTVHPLLFNRFTIVFGSIAAIIIGWNLYVARHAGGHLSGQVVDVAGRPVSGATVRLGRKTITAIDNVRETTTDAGGGFSFEAHGQYWIVLSATQPERGSSERRMLPLWFRNQDVTLSQPLVLGKLTSPAGTN